MIIVQSDQVLAQLKTIDGHAIQNVFKRKKNVIDSTCTPPFIIHQPLTPPSLQDSVEGQHIFRHLFQHLFHHPTLESLAQR